jgi:hypothetical protein
MVYRTVGREIEQQQNVKARLLKSSRLDTYGTIRMNQLKKRGVPRAGRGPFKIVRKELF